MNVAMLTSPASIYHDPHFASVSLLLHANGDNASTTFNDSSLNAVTMTAVGNAQVSTTAPKFGTGSLLCDGTGDYLTTPGSAAYNFGTGDFTVECWMKKAATRAYMVTLGNLLSATDTAFQILADSAGDKLAVYTSNDFLFTGATTLAVGTWYHIAFTRSGTGCTLWIDGVSDATATSSGTIGHSTRQLWVGQTPENIISPRRDFSGNIDEVRITKGVCRYTGTFTPPVRQFPVGN